MDFGTRRGHFTGVLQIDPALNKVPRHGSREMMCNNVGNTNFQRKELQVSFVRAIPWSMRPTKKSFTWAVRDANVAYQRALLLDACITTGGACIHNR